MTGNPPRILVVDDEPMVVKALQRLLSRQGYAVEGCSTPEHFFSRLPAEDAECAIVDLHMRHLDGPELQERMFREGLSVPVIFINGRNDVPSATRALRQGAVDFLVEPLDDGQ